MDTGLREHEEVVRKWLATVIPPEDNKFASLNSAVWSGGSVSENHIFVHNQRDKAWRILVYVPYFPIA